MTITPAERDALQEARRTFDQSVELAAIVAEIGGEKVATIVSAAGWHRSPVDRPSESRQGTWIQRPCFDFLVRVNGWEDLSIRASIEDSPIVDQARGENIVWVVELGLAIDSAWLDRGCS